MLKYFRFLIIPLLILSTPAMAAKPLQYRVWQLQDYNMPHIRHMIKIAPDYGVNRIQLSHKIIMVAEDVDKKPNLKKDINEICRLAHSKGIKVDVWTHELDGVPQELLSDGKANLEDPKLWQWVRDKYAHMFKVCPGIDGLVLTMQETAMSIYHDNKVASSEPAEKRVARLIDSMGDVCKSLHKDFFVRTFSYKPDELEYICAGLKECKSDVIVMSKCQPHDWQPYYPHNPAIGNIGEHPQIIEFDLGYEFLGISRIPYIDLEYLRYRLNYALSKGTVGGVVRIERYKWWAWNTPNWANVEIFSKMLLDPELNQGEAYHDWVVNRYGAKAAPYVISAMSRTYDIVNKSYFALGFWYTNHSFLQNYNQVRDSFWLWSNGKWEPRQRLLERCLLNPTPVILREALAEKDEAIAMASQSLADIEQAKRYLPQKDYAELKRYMEREKAMAEVWKEHTHTFFATRIADQTKDPKYKQEALESAKRLEEMAEKYQSEMIEIASDYSIKDNRVNLKSIKELADKAREVAGK